MYTDSRGWQQAFVVGEVNGTWGVVEEVPGTAVLNTSGVAYTGSVSCASAGDCSAGGSYRGVANYQAFVVGEAKGTWASARKVRGTAVLNAGGDAAVTSVSCASASHCSAGGYYTDANRHLQAFVVGQT